MTNICFDCKNAVPDKEGHGCPWSRKFEPVPGWTAEPVKVGVGKCAADTYCITACPMFEEDREAKPCAIEREWVPVRCVETGKVFRSSRQAEIEMNITWGCISCALRNGRTYAGGYHWEKVKE